jgi:hypothetical protein
MHWWPTDRTFDDKPVAVLLREPLAAEITDLLAADDYYEAVRRVRQRTHLNLLPAVLAVNAVRDATA